MRSLGNILLWGVGLFISLVLFYLFLGGGGVPEWAIQVPNERDPSLVGEWKGTWKQFGNKKDMVVFRQDGTASGIPFGKTSWGTQGNKIYLKYRSAGEGWSKAAASFRVDSSTKSATF